MVASVVVLALAALAQAPNGLAPAPRVVRVDVAATDSRGRAVDTLKAADFELREDGVVQPLDEVRFVKADAGEHVRSVAIYLDDYQISAANTARVKAALTRFVDQDLGPQDLATIMRPLDSLLTIRLTTDRAMLHKAIDAFEGRRGDYEPRNSFERNYIANDPERADIQRAQTTSSALNALALHLATLGPGRKTLLLVGEQAEPVSRRRGLEGLPTLASVIRTASRTNVAIYALDPRSGTSEDVGPSEERESLRMLADSTDGAVIGNTPDLQDGLRRMLAEAAAYYVLTYRSPQPFDGLFHALEVRVSTKGVRVRARKGYWAPTADEIQRAQIVARANEPRPAAPVEPARRTSPLIRPWFGLARGANGKTRVTFVWEPSAQVPGDRRLRTPRRVGLLALGADGSTLFDGMVLAVDPTALDARDDSAMRAVFDAAPGRLRLRMSIEDAATVRIDSDVRDILVRDLRAPVAMGTPEVLRARTARDVRALDAASGAVPVASREFSRTEQLVIRIPAYAPDETALDVSATLVNRTGQTMRQLTMRGLALPDVRRQIDLPLAGLAPGEYAVQIVASGPAGQATDTVNFRVTN